MFLGSLLGGFALYIGVMALFFGMSYFSLSDLLAVCCLSLVPYAPTFFGLYLPALFGVRRLLRGVRPLWPFPFVAVLLGVIPTAALGLFWEVRSVFFVSGEALLVYSVFATVGIVVGFVFVFVYRHDNVA